MRWKSLIATANLGFYFARRLLKRLFFIRSPGLKEFVSFYREDRIATLTREEKDLLTASSRCISCGLCEATCPPASKASLFLGPSFLPHLSRSIPDFSGAVILDSKMCERCNGCETICPESVPLKRIFQFLEEKSKR